MQDNSVVVWVLVQETDVTETIQYVTVETGMGFGWDAGCVFLGTVQPFPGHVLHYFKILQTSNPKTQPMNKNQDTWEVCPECKGYSVVPGPCHLCKGKGTVPVLAIRIGQEVDRRKQEYSEAITKANISGSGYKEIIEAVIATSKVPTFGQHVVVKQISEETKAMLEKDGFHVYPAIGYHNVGVVGDTIISW